jgi:acetyl esterase/lipase
MVQRHARLALATMLTALAVHGGPLRAQPGPDLEQRLDRLTARIGAAEDVSSIKKLQRAYGYYVDEGMWADLAELFTDDAVANYPAGVFIGKDSIRRHLFENVGGVELGQIGLGDGRLYNHMNIQPVVHLDPGGQTAKGRWRALAMFGNYGGGAVWAEGVYEMTYAKTNGVWKIETLDYYSGFGASYDTGWVDTGPPRRGPRNLAHAPDRERNRACEGFPDACIAPFHYDNPGTSASGHVWTKPREAAPAGAARKDLRERARALDARARVLRDEQQIENLQRIYGYYVDRAMWDQVADLFADDGTIEMGQRGVYVGKPRIREFLNLLGPAGLTDGRLNDHIQLQIIADVSPDGHTARSRSRELAMTGEYQGSGTWSEGTYENSYVKQDGVWKIKSLHFYPTFITDYDQGWAKDAQPAPEPSTKLPPDRGPTEVYEIYPKAYVPPFHYPNPVTGKAPQYPQRDGRPSRRAIRAAMTPVRSEASADEPFASGGNIEAIIADAEWNVQRVKDYDELENLESAYGYYLDKNLWNDLADLFSENGSMELAQRGVYVGRERVRAFLLKVFGRGSEGPVAGRLGNHLQLQPVIDVAPDGRSAKIRSRLLQQMSFGERASLGAAVYENEAVKENGVWKLSVDHAYNTWTAAYDGGWAESPGTYVPGPSEDFPPDRPPTHKFDMFPTVYDVPFHYANPVSGRPAYAPADASTAPMHNVDMPPSIAEELRAIGPQIDPQRTTAIYAPLQPAEPYAGVSVTRDVAYGPDERNVLDIFDAGGDTPKPVVVFVHGGGFSRGAKHTPGSPFYDNVALWAASEGLLGVNINYRLAPEHRWPSGIEDLTALVGWLKQHVAEYGGDPARIYLWGHSAGASHVGDYLAHEVEMDRDSGLAGAILTSGFYDLGDEVSIWRAYYGDDVSKYAERSSLPRLVQTSTPLFVNDAELDPPGFRPQTAELVHALKDAGRTFTYVHLPSHSHLSETYAVGTADRSLSRPVLEFIESTAR